MAAARTLAAEGGFAAVSLDDIASQAGVTAAVIYRHFPGKAALAEAVLLDLLGRFGSIPEVGGLTGLVRRSIELALDEPDLLSVYLREYTAPQPPAVHAQERRLQDRWSAAILSDGLGCDLAGAVVRQRAVLGALAGTAVRAAPVARPRLDELLARSALAVLRCPCREPDPQAPVRPEAGWRSPPTRADAILDVALELFRQRGFAGTGVDDIAAALGLAGSAIYRTYPRKSDILLDAYDRAGARVLVGVEDALAAATGPADALTRLATSFAAVTVGNIDLIAVTSREGAALPDRERPRLSRRRRTVRETWAAVLGECRPELTAAEARVLVSGVFPLATETALGSRHQSIEPAEVADLMLAFVTGPR
ncbi:MAG TPA: TetR family transcriptional regulator [Streptosporangiaceae bacterium]|nr:TetR family transcriptional regulator [Streptosporangiaceae bacterium]